MPPTISMGTQIIVPIQTNAMLHQQCKSAVQRSDNVKIKLPLSRLFSQERGFLFGFGGSNRRRALFFCKFFPHAPREGSDVIQSHLAAGGDDFNPRSPCGERQPMLGITLVGYGFQSTLPVRGATLALIFFGHGRLISIHVPHAGSDNYHIYPIRWQVTPCGMAASSTVTS